MKFGAVAGIATAGLYKVNKGAIREAAQLQESAIGIKTELMEAGRNTQKIANIMKTMKGTAFSVQSWTPYNMAQIMDLEKELVKAGLKVGDIAGKNGAAAATAALAVYENLDPVATGVGMVKIATPFGVGGSGYMKQADMIAAAASASVTGAAEIVEAAKYAAGPMSDLGRPQKEMLAMSAMLAQVGVDSTMAGTSLRVFFTEAAKVKAFKDVNGDMIETGEIISKLRERFGDMGNADRREILTDIFGIRGGVVASALIRKGKGNWEEINEAIDKAASLQDKLDEAMKGFNKRVTALRGNVSSTIANLFQPALVPATALVKKVDELVSGIGRASMESDTLNKTVSNMSLGSMALGGVATAGAGVGALYYLRKSLKGAGGWKALFGRGASTAAGIAEGKAIEAATGVSSVFVTNWPAGFGAGGVASQAAAAAGLGFGGKAKKLFGAGAGILTKNPLVAAIAAGAIGGGMVGKYAYNNTDLGRNYGDWMGEKLDRILYPQAYGEETKNTVNISLHVDKDGRVIAETEDANTELAVGSYF